MTEELAAAGFARAFARHLGGLKGISGGQAIARSGDGTADPAWQEIARIGRVATDDVEAALAGFDPASGGTVRPLDGEQGGWLASYATAGPGVQLLVRLTLVRIPPGELQQILAQIEQRMGWLLVEAERHFASQRRNIALSSEASAEILLGAAEAGNRTILADQWIARLERALGADLIAVCWVQGHAPKLGSISGGGVIQQPGAQRSALETLAELTIEARNALVLQKGDAALGERKARALSELKAAQALCIPVYEGDPCRAVIILMWSDPAQEIPDGHAADLIGRVLGEAVTIQARAYPALLRRARNWLLTLGAAVFGRRALKLKIALVVISLALMVAALTPTRHSPAFNARIEARDRLLVAAPFDGFLAEAGVALGDRVTPGAMLIRMEEDDLRLERSRLAAEAEQLGNAVQTARAQRDTSSVRDLDARLQQNQVQAALIDSQISRASVSATRSGLVIGGDASRRVGGRVRLGETLVELASVDSLEAQVNIDEDWVSDLPEGATGTLLLSAWPDRPIPVTLERITSNTEALEGTNTFIGWMRLDLPADLPLMDGMRGIVRIEGGETSVLGRYGRGIGRWFARNLWRWS